MDALATLTAVFITLVGLGLASGRWGIDSRTPIGDDHRR